jgi:hypothetical protein
MTTMPTTTSQPIKQLAALSGLLALLASGCTQSPHCEDLATCGGTLPYGSWALTQNEAISCTEDLYQAPIDTRLLGGEVPAARVPTIEPALFDWCNLLVASSGETLLMKTPLFFYESGRIGAVSLRYNQDGSFSAGLTRTGTFTLDFPAVCMRAFGATETPGAPIGELCKQLEVPLAASGAGEGSYRNTTCYANPEEPLGCLCTFDVTETGGPGGRFQQISSNTLLHTSGAGFPSKVTYCHEGNSLELTGADGAYLFNAPGLRTLKLTLVSDPAAP